MTLDIRVNNQSLRDLLTAPPVITDQLEAVCRSLTFSTRAAAELENFIGQPVELWYGDKVWFFGFLFRRSFSAQGNIDYTVYDPLYYWKKNTDDYYFKNMTATQVIKNLAGKVGTRVGNLANTGVVFKALYYPGADPDKIAVDTLARTAKQNNKKYWYRYEPDKGVTLFERVVPSSIWAFQVGVNLEEATYEESIEETATAVKLVNRETGKTVTRFDAAAIKKYGNMVHFEEVDKDQAALMEKNAAALLKQLSKVNVTSSITGINPDRTIPQLFSGDVVYVEEKYTQLIGAYHIKNLTQTFLSDNLVRLNMDIQEAPDVPALQYEDATKAPDNGVGKSKTKGNGVSTNATYSAEMQKVIDRYGLEGK